MAIATSSRSSGLAKKRARHEDSIFRHMQVSLFSSASFFILCLFVFFILGTPILLPTVVLPYYT